MKNVAQQNGVQSVLEFLFFVIQEPLEPAPPEKGLEEEEEDKEKFTIIVKTPTQPKLNST